MLSDNSRAVLEGQSEHAQLQALTAKLSGDRGVADCDQRLTALNAQLVESAGQVEIMYKQVTVGDSAPTAAQTNAVAAVQSSLGPLLNMWNQLQTELTGLNKRLRRARLDPVRPELPAPRDINVADEE